VGPGPRGGLVAELRLDRSRCTFDLDGAAILVPDGTGWRPVAVAGGPAPARPADAQFAAELDQGAMLALSGRSLSGEDTRLIGPFVTQLRLAQERARLQGEAAAAAELAEADAARAALLEAVSHDLRTPLTGIKAAIGSKACDVVGESYEVRMPALAIRYGPWQTVR
jgi:two-component system, OmpR family, sensor histidine kinase KdpD